MLGGAHDTMGMGYGVLTPVLKPKIFFAASQGARTRETHEEIREHWRGSCKKIKKTCFHTIT